MKSIDTLIEDIYAVLASNDYTLTGTSVRNPEREGPATLRMSNIGRPCVRQLWYSIHEPDSGEEVLPHTKLKFSYGDILEDVILDLAEMAGHTVTHRQEELELLGVKGHCDAVIDGVVVDVKTASKFSFKKFEEGMKLDEDSFGYIVQLASYLISLSRLDDAIVKNKACFLAVNKETGRLHLDVHEFTDRFLEEVLERYESVILGIQGATVPARAFAPQAEGKSGNYKLGVECSYCPFRFRCYPQTRTFLYANGPRYLTTVASEPKVPEVDRDGNIVKEGFNF